MNRLPLIASLLAGVAAGGFCAQDRAAASAAIALRGTIVSSTSVLTDGTIAFSDGTITSVGASSAGNASGAIDVGGVIFPGLVDLHNHITWNAFVWDHPRHDYSTRYEWQEDPGYLAALATPHADLAKTHNCDLNRFGELKAIVNGATSTVGAAFDPCIAGLARNLDFLSELDGHDTLGAEPFRNEIFPFEIKTPCGEQALRDVGGRIGPCANGAGSLTPGAQAPKAFVAHVGEGRDASARREFTMFESHGFLRAGANIIHGVALTAVEFKKMKAAGVGLVWSPRSNIDLYGQTTAIQAARDAGVTIAIAPDWSPSGSDGMLGEIAYARSSGKVSNPFSDKELFEMATINPATMARATRIGDLAPTYAADLIVMRAPTSGDAYAALTTQTAGDLLLVIVGGVPVYGEPALMKQLAPAAALEPITICGQQRVVNVQTGIHSKEPWAGTEQALTQAFTAMKLRLAKLACEH